MVPVLAAAAFLPVTLMVAVAVLRGAVGLTNRFLARDSRWADEYHRAAWYTGSADHELPEPGLLPTVVPTVAAAVVVAAGLFGYAYVSALLDQWPFVAAIPPRVVGLKMIQPYALLACVPVFLLFRTRAMAGLLRTTFPRAAAVVAFEVLIWGVIGATAMAARSASGYGPSLSQWV